MDSHLCGSSIVKLKKGRDKSCGGFHPWVFSGSVESAGKNIQTGDIVDVVSAEGGFLGRGFYNKDSAIAVRIMSFENVELNREFFAGKIQNAINLRKQLDITGTAYRLIHDSGDFIPGLFADKFGDYIVVQFLSAGLYQRKEMIVEIIADLLKPKGIYDRSDSSIMPEEGFEPNKGVLYGEEPPDKIYITEGGIKFPVFIKTGQKTGFYADLRSTRHYMKKLMDGKNVLNLFSYTGSLSVCALEYGAKHVKSVESSRPFLSALEDEVRLRGMEPRHEAVCGNAFEFIRSSKDNFDVIIVDPPPLCQKKSHVDKASRAYKDVNMQAIKRVNDGGLIFTLCCSHHISLELFRKIIFASAKDAKKDVRLIRTICQGSDHPINIFHPETEYFKGFMLAVN